MRKPTIYFAAAPKASLLLSIPIPLTQSLSLVKKNTCLLILPERGHFVLTNHMSNFSAPVYFAVRIHVMFDYMNHNCLINPSGQAISYSSFSQAWYHH